MRSELDNVRRNYFENRVVRGVEDDCWTWMGAQHFSNGGGPYGRAFVVGLGVREQWYAHRLSWVLHRGPLSNELTIDHLCRNTLCVNPAHLEPVTQSVNSRRGAAHYRAEHPECPKGHDDWSYRSTNGTRYCAECNRNRNKEKVK